MIGYTNKQTKKQTNNQRLIQYIYISLSDFSIKVYIEKYINSINSINNKYDLYPHAIQEMMYFGENWINKKLIYLQIKCFFIITFLRRAEFT